MRRKINLVGTSTLTISLPAKTAKKFRLKKGDEVEVREQGNTILIELGKPKAKEAGSLYFKHQWEFLKRYITNLYNQGYDTIEITSDEPLNAREIKTAINEMLGFEIVDQGEKHCTIRNVANPDDSEFDSILRRLFYIINLMARNGLEGMSKRNQNLLRETIDLDAVVNKFANFCIRVICQQKPVNSLHLHFIISQLEQIADGWKEVCKQALAYKTSRHSPSIVKFYENIITQFGAVHDSFYRFDMKKMPLLKQKRIELFKQGEALLEKTSGSESILVHHLLEILNKIHHMEISISYCAPAAE